MRNISGGANTCARWNPGAAELSNFSSILSIGVSPNISPIICIISSIWCCIIVIGDVCAKRLDKGDDGYMYLDTGARVRCCTGAFIDDTFSPRVSSRAVCGDSARVVVITPRRARIARCARRVVNRIVFVIVRAPRMSRARVKVAGIFLPSFERVRSRRPRSRPSGRRVTL
jgi:hypothetical protein|tara:strand:+ start:2598 stop:3110 length:513 start_codon:yes stop_codon:yes gene_type:complete